MMFEAMAFKFCPLHIYDYVKAMKEATIRG